MKALPLVLSLLLGAAAQDSATKVAAAARFAAEAPAGSTARLEVTLTAAEGWHFYGPGDPYEGQAVAFSVTGGGEGLEVGPFVPSRPPKAHKYEFEENPRMEYEGAVTFAAEVKVPAGTAAGKRTVTGVATVNACDAAMCLPPGDAAWSADLVVTAGGAAAAPRLPDSGDRVKVTAAAAGPARLAVTLEIDHGWHVYGPGDFEKQDTVVRVTKAPPGARFGAFTPDRAPETTQGEYEKGPRKEFHGTVTYAADEESGILGPLDVEGEVVVAACNADGCLPEGRVAFRASLPGRTKANLKVDSKPSFLPVPGGPGEGGISLGFLLTAVVAGLLTIATPCVFPMIPLTVSLLTKRAEKEPEKILNNALAYWAGMFVSLAGIGLAMSLVFGVAPSDLALSPGFNLVIFAFLMYLALSLLGAYDIQLPSFMTSWAQSKAGTGGGTGLFFMGMVLAFTSFACAAPFAGVLVVEARTSVVKGVVGMSVYAATFATPFFLTALFPGILKSLPRSGGWLNAVKVVMGFVEVAAAFKFLRAADLLWEWGVFSRTLVVAVWVACAFGASLYLLGLLVLPHDTKTESIGVPRLLWALAFAAAGFFLLPGVFHRPLPPVIDSFILVSEDEPMWTSVAIPNAGGAEAELAWIRNDLDEALRQAKAAGKPVFVDFTGFG